MRIAIIGSRTVTSQFYEMLCQNMPIGASEIISGGAQGADSLAAQYATQHGLHLTVISPDYARFGKRAPLERNERIVRSADYVLALWDGTSRGTAQAIDYCVKNYTPVRVFLCRAQSTCE